MGNLTQGVRGVATNGNAFGIFRCNLCSQCHLGRCGPIVQAVAPNLSYRQNQVIYLICEGMSNSQIAEQLGISVETIKRHITDILNICGKESRMQIALHYSSLILNERVAQLEADLAALKLKHGKELQQEKAIVLRLERQLQRELRTVDVLTKKQNGGASKTIPGTNNPRVRHWLRPAQ